MPISGTGTQADPFVVTTYSELAEKITNPDGLAQCYIKVGNDIDIANEYPFGDMPILDFGVNVYLDGDGKTITNWYYTGTASSIIKLYNKNNHDCQMKNLKLLNIAIKSTSGYFLQIADSNGSYSNDVIIDDCLFVGETFMQFCDVRWTNSTYKPIRSCTINILLRGSNTRLTSPGYAAGFESCNFNIVTEGTGSGFINTDDFSRYGFSNCNLNISIPNASRTSSITISNAYYDNCVIKLTTPQSLQSGTATFGRESSSISTSILNVSDCPGVHASSGTQIKEVTDSNWHDITYLQSIGFSAGERLGGSE